MHKTPILKSRSSYSILWGSLKAFNKRKLNLNENHFPRLKTNIRYFFARRIIYNPKYANFYKLIK